MGRGLHLMARRLIQVPRMSRIPGRAPATPCACVARLGIRGPSRVTTRPRTYTSEVSRIPGRTTCVVRRRMARGVRTTPGGNSPAPVHIRSVPYPHARDSRRRRGWSARGDTGTPKPGGHSGGETRVPIPNTTVKPSSAEDTGSGSSRESRTLPGERRTREPAGEEPWRASVFFVFATRPDLQHSASA